MTKTKLSLVALLVASMSMSVALAQNDPYGRPSQEELQALQKREQEIQNKVDQARKKIFDRQQDAREAVFKRADATKAKEKVQEKVKNAKSIEEQERKLAQEKIDKALGNTPVATSSTKTVQKKVVSKGTTEKAANGNIPAVPASTFRNGSDKDPAAVEKIDKFASASNNRSKKVRINRNNEIELRPGDNVFIPISKMHPNRLLTPFKNPQVVSSTLAGGTKDGECGELCVRNGVIYITTDANGPVTTFVTDRTNESVAFSVTMIPQNIPPRQVTFTFPESVMEELAMNVEKGETVARQWEESQPYIETLKSAMRSIALGQVPQGYNMRKTLHKDQVPTCKQEGLAFRWMPGQVLEGYNLNVFVGVIKNVSDRPVEFLEKNCGNWRSAAVTSWPLKVLRPGQQTEIYVATKRAEDVIPDQVRKPLIHREYN